MKKSIDLINGLKIRLLTILIILSVPIYSFGQESNPVVVAKDGDGIYSLLRANGIAPTPDHIADFVQLNGMDDNRRLLKGKKYLLPVYSIEILLEKQDTLQNIKNTTEEIVNKDSILIVKDLKEDAPPVLDTVELKSKEIEFGFYPIFGRKHEEVEIKSSSLQGAVYYLISGHGGPDPGALGQYGTHQLAEDEYAYDVILRLARRLLSHQATVHLIIKDKNDGIRGEKILKMDKDEVAHPGQSIPRSQKSRLRQRVKIVNELYHKDQSDHKRLIVIHVDSRSAGKNIDVFFYHAEKSKTGKKLANRLQDVFKKKYKEFQPNREYFGNVNHRDLYVVEKTLPATVFVELGNIKSQTDQKRFLLDSNREALANWICEGLLEEYKELHP